MAQTKQHQAETHRLSGGRIVGAVVAVGGLSTSVFAVSSAGAATSHTAKSIVISTVKNSKLGTLLVSGKTLYTLSPSKTPCTAACTTIWPEVLLPKGVTKATAGTGVSAAKLGSIMRANGRLQVTYGGKALYWFSGDSAVGQVHGNLTDTWGTWSDYVTVKPVTSSSGSGTSPSSGGNTGTGGVAF
jgi:predicted lipoprotein with Yx(FWY)xxD motif